MKVILPFLLFISLTTTSVFGQIKIGDNPQNIDPSSVLELESSSKVLVITRVSTSDMNAISPQRGGMVYNTDTECIHYYDGSTWINLCDAVSFSITNDPIVNTRSTISITETPNNYNLEIEPGSIRSVHIAAGGINGTNIQNNSIGQAQLGQNSVGIEELRDNSVGSEELRDNTIRTNDFDSDFPNQQLITDEFGVVQWRESDELFDLTFNKADTTLQIARSTIPGISSVNLGALIGSDDQQLTLVNNILSLENDDSDIDLTTYLNTDNQDLSNVLTVNNDANGILIKNLGTPVDNQDAVTKEYVDNSIGGVGGTGNIISTDLTVTGGNSATFGNVTLEVAPGVINTAELANNAVTTIKLANNSVNSTKIANATILAEDLNQMGAVTGQTLKWNGTIWVPAADNGGTNYTAGDALNLTAGDFDVNVDNNTIEVVGDALQIKDLGITAAKLNDMGAVDGQVLKWNGTSTAWEPAADTGGTNYTAGDALSLTAGDFDVNVDDNTIEVVGDALQIKDLGITAVKLNDMGAVDGQVLKWNGTSTSWEPAADAGGTSYTAGDALNLTAGDFDVNVDDNTIEVVGDALQIKDLGITAVKLNDMGAVDGQVLKWNGTSTSWEPAADAGGTSYTAGDALNLTAGDFDVNVDDNTIEVVGDALQIKDLGITAVKLNDMGAVDGQVLKWNGTSTSWEPAADAGGTSYTAGDALSLTAGDFDVNVDDTTIEVVGDALQLKNDGITLNKIANNGASDEQVLKWDADLNGGLGAWTTAADATGTTITDADVNDGLTTFSATTGYSVNVDDTTIELVGDALQLKNDGITLNKIANNGASDEQVLKWDADLNGGLGAWTTAADATGTTITDADVNDGLTTFSATTGYSVNVDDTTIELVGDALQLKNDGITLNKIANNGASDEQVLKWDADLNGGLGAWTTAADATGTTITDADVNDGLTTFSATTGYSVNVDDTTIELVGDALQLKNDGITLNKIANNGASDEQVLKWDADLNGGLGAWTTAADATGTTITDADVNDGLTTFSATTGYSVNVDDTTIELSGDALRIKPSTTTGQVLKTIGSVPIWQNLTDDSNNGSILFSDGTGGIAENNDQFFWDNNNNRLGIGTGSPTSKVQVIGQVQASSFSANPNGLETNPPFRFINDPNSGMFLANTSELAFTTNSAEKMRIIANGNVGIGISNPLENLHVSGNIRTDGSFLSTDGIIGVPDYVFQKYFTGTSTLNEDYTFKNLTEIEYFVKQNKHLPGVKSAAAIKAQGFWDLGEASRINLEKIEELFLHIIEQEKKIKALESANKTMANEMDLLKEQLAEIKKLVLAKNKD